MRLARRVCASATLELPFLFEPAHSELGEQARQFAVRAIKPDEDKCIAQPVPTAQGRRERARWVAQQMGAGRFLALCVPPRLGGRSIAAPPDQTDARAQALVRESLAWATGPAEHVFGVQCAVAQALFTGPAGNNPLAREYLSALVEGRMLGALAVTEDDAGSNPAAIAASAQRDHDHYRLDARKTYVALAGAADFFVVLARTSGQGPSGVSAFLLRADDEGVAVDAGNGSLGETAQGTLVVRARVPASRRLGAEGDGLRAAMHALDATRCTTAAAAAGYARRALDESLSRVSQGPEFDAARAVSPHVRALLADLACDADAARLMAYRAAHARDTGTEHVAFEGAQAKVFSVESAQRAVDRAVQLFGTQGVTRGSVVERLCREVRALRASEGGTDLHRLVIAGILLGAERARASEERALQADRGTTRQLRAPRTTQSPAPGLAAVVITHAATPERGETDGASGARRRDNSEK